MVFKILRSTDRGINFFEFYHIIRKLFIQKRPCLPILIFMVLSLIFNQWDIERDKYDGPRIIPEDSSTTGVYLRSLKRRWNDL